MTNDGKPLKAVVFDMDGVIFDSERKVIECWQVIAQKYQIAGIEEVCLRCLGVTREATRNIMLAAYGEAFPYDAYKQEASALFHERYGHGRLPVKPGVRELMRFLKEKGKKIALASSTRKEVVLQELSDAGLLQWFDAVICGDMVQRSKPAPDIFAKACDVLDVAPGCSVAIEDSYNGVRSAKAAGLRPLMVPDLAAPTPEMETLAECILPSLLEVKTYLMREVDILR